MKPPIRYYPGWASNISLEKIMTQVQWYQEHLNFFGKQVKVPRLVAFYGEAGLNYTYSGKTHTAPGWTVMLKQFKQRLHSQLSLTFNVALCNLYHDGQDYMGWHADNEASLGPEPIIASLSFGGSRDFMLKHRITKQKHLITLHHGDLLIMDPPSQEQWLHCLPKRAHQNNPRVNITFRHIIY